MPSVYNHENCWGVKKSYCNLFEYTDVKENLQSSKHLGISTNSSNASTVQQYNPLQFSVSSNGYYGYQPHSINHTNKDCQMEVDADFHVNVPQVNSNMFGHSVSTTNFQLQNVRRKRNLQSDMVDFTKRMRQEEPFPESKISEPEPHQYGGGGSRLRVRRNCSTDNDLENTTQLLRQTHGCELYLYERSCDY